MYWHILLPQFKRAHWQTTVFPLLLAIATAFFCLSANLYRNSKSNIKSAQNAFSTVAVIEFYKNLDQNGNQVSQISPDYVGRFVSTVDDLSMDTLCALPGMEAVDVRQMLGAYVPGSVDYRFYENHGSAEEDEELQFFDYDLIRFSLIGDSPVILTVGKEAAVPLKIISHANPLLHYEEKKYSLVFYSNDILPYAEDLMHFNGITEPKDILILQPGVEYLASVVSGNNTYSEDLGLHQVNAIGFEHDHYGMQYFPRYRQDLPVFTHFSEHENQPFWIWRWDDVQDDPKITDYFESVAQAYVYSAQSFAVMTTENMEGILQFHQKKFYIFQGRELSLEDEKNENCVCVISSKLAEYQGWQVGDTINMSFYRYDAFWEGAEQIHYGIYGHMPLYVQNNGGFIDSGTYTIVGIWAEPPNKVHVGLDAGTESLLYNTIIVPTSSVQNLDTVDAPASGSRLTVHLENGMMEEFLEAASKVTLSESADEVRITAFDQGYSQAQDSLQSMLGTAQFLLVLSSVLLVVAGVLLAFFYVKSQKQNMALMRLLGCNRRQAGTMAILGSLMILLPGGLLGMGAGHLLTDWVASAILSGTNTLDKPEYAAFREAFGIQIEVEFALSAQPAVSAVALALAAGLFLAGCLLFILLQLKKEPREALADQ